MIARDRALRVRAYLLGSRGCGRCRRLYQVGRRGLDTGPDDLGGGDDSQPKLFLTAAG